VGVADRVTKQSMSATMATTSCLRTHLPPSSRESLSSSRSSCDGFANGFSTMNRLGLPANHGIRKAVRCSSGVESIRAAGKKGAPPMMPMVMSPSGPTDLSTLMLRNRVIFVGSPVNGQVAQRVISQLLTLAAIDEDEEIKMYINCPGGSTYSILAIYDTMAWIKPKVSTVCFGIAASQGALLLAGGEKGRRFAMPNARIMIHQPQGGCGGTADDVRRQVNEIMQSRDKLDKMYAAFTGQPLERVQQFTDRDRFFSASEAMEFGLVDALLETEY
jgi:ATP-dependent Clp protease protease subunit